MVGMIFRDWRDSWRRTTRRTNPVILRCSACNAELHRKPHGWAYVLEWAGWIAVVNVALPHSLPFGWGMFFAFGLCIPFQMATRRLYHNWWVWRHPTRCQGRGTPAPAKADAGS